MKLLIWLITIQSFRTTAFVVDVPLLERFRPLNALGLNEPFAQVNPVFSKIRKSRIISPPVAVVAEDDLVSKETATSVGKSTSRTRTVQRPWKARAERPWKNRSERDFGIRTAIIAEGGDVKKGRQTIMEKSFVRTSTNGAASTSRRRESIVAEGGDVRGENVMEGAVGAVSSERTWAKGTTKPSSTTGAETAYRQETATPNRVSTDKEGSAAAPFEEKTQPWTAETSKAQEGARAARAWTSHTTNASASSASASETAKTATGTSSSKAAAAAAAEEDEDMGPTCFVSTTRTFVANNEGEADGSTTRKFVAGPSCSSTDDGVDDDSAEDSSAFDASFRGAVMYEAFAGVGDALAGCGEALMTDTMAARESLTNWMELFPLFFVSGGSAALVGELIVAAIVSLLVRNAAKIQEAVIHDEEAASKYEEDGWWGNFASEMDETTKLKKSQSAKKVTYVKVLKDSLVKDILGKRPYEYTPQSNSYRTISEQETQPEKVKFHSEQGATRKDSLNDTPVEHPVVEEPRLERTTIMDNLVLEFPVLSSTEEFRTNQMLDFSSVPPEAWKDPFVLDILKKKKVHSSTTSPLYSA